MKEHQSQIPEVPLQLKPTSKFDLITKVGSKGLYQRMLVIIFCGVQAITGMALIGTTFFFLDTPFKCQRFGLLSQDCNDVVCSLPESQWSKFIHRENNQLNTIATQLGNYHCGNELYLNLAQSSTYLGALTGYLVLSYFADNYGRKFTFVLGWSLAVAGAILLYLSQNLIMVGIGLFLLGGGSDACINLCFYYFGEVVEYEARQRYSVQIQVWFPIGACLITTMFIWVHEWRWVALLLIVIPSILIFVAIIFYIEETPQFLIRKGIPQTLKALNRIGYINSGVKNILGKEDIIRVMEEQVEEKQFDKKITLLDLVRFQSLRVTSISICLVSLFSYALYYGPVLVIDKIGFNVYVSSYVVQFSEIIVYLPLYYLIDSIPRQKAAIMLFTIVGACAIFLLFLEKPNDCDFCSEAILQLIIVAIFRASGAIEFILVLIYVIELFPARTRGIGCGIASCFGTIASSMSPLLLGLFDRNKINPNIMFTIFALLAVGVSTLIPETRGVPLREEIEEVELAKQEVKRNTLLVSKAKEEEDEIDR